MRIISFIAASSNSGKTTLIERIVPLLKTRGLRVAVIKHASKGFDMDQRGKDSWRFREAGADAVLLAGPDQLALMRQTDRPLGPEELATLLPDYDIVLVEGFRDSTPNRIEVFRKGISGERPLCMDNPAFVALASDTRFELAIPCFDLNDATSIANFILAKLQL